MSLFLLIISSIPTLIIALLVKATSRGPVFYWSDRVGKDNTIFKMPKFRTMKINTPAVATHLMEKPDQYLTSIGKFLRELSLDELPQLFSILKGDMSFVGPRPLAKGEIPASITGFQERHQVRPGLTGTAQVYAPRDEKFEEKFQYDLDYIRNRTFGGDLNLLFLSLWITLRGKWESRQKKF